MAVAAAEWVFRAVGQWMVVEPERHRGVPHQLTVIVPCKNERRNIRPCLDSVRGLADEILVADSGSTDGTLEIVRSLGGARIIEREYIHSGDFKNWAIPQARHDWVLILDADERVPPALAAEIKQLLAGDPRCDGYWLRRANHFMGHRVRFGPWGNDLVLRLFRKSCGRYVGDNDHAEVSVGAGRTSRLRHKLTHYTFWTYQQYLTKIERYATYQARLWHGAGIQPRLWKLFINFPFRFVQNYVFRLGFLDGAVGFQVSLMIAFYSFQKQAYHWELCYGRRQPDPEQEHAMGAHETATAAGRFSAIKFLYRAWRYRWRVEPAEIAFVRNELRPGQTCLDIGGHKGAFTYWMQAQVGRDGRVFTFEPQPELACYLQQAKQALRLHQVEVVAAGLSSEPGVLPLYRDSDSPSPGATVEPRSKSGAALLVPVESLDHFFSNRPGRPVHFIKCDVEGHELAVFRGAAAILREDRPTLLFECEQRHHERGSMTAVFDYLHSLGYEGQFIRRGRLWPLSQFDPAVNQPGARDYVYNFVFRHCAVADASPRPHLSTHSISPCGHDHAAVQPAPVPGAPPRAA